jgi:hypothetical protein
MNRDKGVPESENPNRPLITDFPIKNPIFWGPGQATKFPDEYSKPEGWKANEVLNIPKVVRYFIGYKPAEPDTYRCIYLGHMNYCVVRQIPAEIPRRFPYQDHIPLREYQYYTEFQQANEISTLGANLSTSALLNSVMNTGPVGKFEAFLSGIINMWQPFFSTEYVGLVDYPFDYFDPTGTIYPYTYHSVSIIENGGTAPATGPNFTDNLDDGNDFNSYPLTELYVKYTKSTLSGIDVIDVRLARTFHIYLVNNWISGVQTNTLYVVIGDLGWDNDPPSTDINYVPAGIEHKDVPFLDIPP